MVRRIACNLLKSQSEIASAQLRLFGKLGQRNRLCKVQFNVFDCAANTRVNGNAARRVQPTQHSGRKGARKPLEIGRPKPTTVFGFFRQEPAQRFEPSIDPKRTLWQAPPLARRQAYLSGDCFDEARRGRTRQWRPDP